MVSFKQTFTGELSFPIFLLEYPSCSHVLHSFINFSIYVCGLWSSFSSSLPSCTLLHLCFPVWTTHVPPNFGNYSPYSCSFHKPGLTWLLFKKPLTNSFLIIPETLIHQHLLDLVAKFILPLPFILLQILLLWFVWWNILHCSLWRVERLTQKLFYWAFFSLPFLSEFFSMEHLSFSSATT